MVCAGVWVVSHCRACELCLVLQTSNVRKHEDHAMRHRFNPFPALITSDVISDFTSSPLDIGADDTRFFCTYHLAG